MKRQYWCSPRSFFCRARSVAVNSPAHFLIVCDPLAERATTNDFLLCRRKLFELQTWLSAKLSHGTLQHDIEVFPDDPVLCSERSRAVLMPGALSFLLMRLPTPQTSSTGIRASSRRWRSMFDKSTTPSVWRCHFFAAWLASLARVFVWAMPTPTVRCVRFRTVALISRPKSVRSRQFRTPSDHKRPHQCCKFLPAAPSPRVWSLPGSTYQRKARNYC